MIFGVSLQNDSCTALIMVEIPPEQEIFPEPKPSSYTQEISLLPHVAIWRRIRNWLAGGSR